MTAAIGLLTIGGLMVYSAIHGVSIVDVLRGVAGDTIDAKGGKPAGTAGTAAAPLGADDPTPLIGGITGGKRGFAGPHAALLDTLADAAEHQFHLTITSLFSGGHVVNSNHYKRRAFDAAGLAVDMAAYAQWAWREHGAELLELYYSPAGITVKNGRNMFPAVYDKPNHVHTAA